MTDAAATAVEPVTERQRIMPAGAATHPMKGQDQDRDRARGAPSLLDPPRQVLRRLVVKAGEALARARRNLLHRRFNRGVGIHEVRLGGACATERCAVAGQKAGEELLPGLRRGRIHIPARQAVWAFQHVAFTAYFVVRDRE